MRVRNSYRRISTVLMFVSEFRTLPSMIKLRLTPVGSFAGHSRRNSIPSPAGTDCSVKKVIRSELVSRDMPHPAPIVCPPKKTRHLRGNARRNLLGAVEDRRDVVRRSFNWATTVIRFGWLSISERDLLRREFSAIAHPCRGTTRTRWDATVQAPSMGSVGQSATAHPLMFSNWRLTVPNSRVSAGTGPLVGRTPRLGLSPVATREHPSWM